MPRGIHTGAKKHPHYSMWANIKVRCWNPKCKDFEHYGGRGINIYKEWRFDFWEFANYIDTNLGPRPPKHSIDRINNDGDYEPGNLRWSDNSKQQLNRRPYGTIQHKGVSIDKGRFRSQIWVNGKLVHLGFFDSAEEAAQVWELAKHQNLQLNTVN